MKDFVHQLSREFYTFPIFLQVIFVSVSCVLFVFLTDCWFSPYVLQGYRLATYLFLVTLLAAYSTKKSLKLLYRSRFIWAVDNFNENIEESRKLSIRDVSERELEAFAKSSVAKIVNFWQDCEFSDDDEFIKEIGSQIADTVSQLSEKLSRVELQDFLRNLILILHNHVRSYNKAASLSDAPIQHFRFAHPVHKGELSLENYLDCLSHSIMKEFIPGSVQDCQAVFDLLCSAFSSQFLLKFIDYVSQPELFLTSLVEVLGSIDSTTATTTSTATTTTSLCSSFCDPVQDFLVPDLIPEKKEDFGTDDKVTNQPINGLLSGLVMESCIEMGLSNSISTLTIPLLSQREESKQIQIKFKLKL